MRGIVSLLVQAAGVTELAGRRVDGPFVVRLERRILAAPATGSGDPNAGTYGR